jgi:hypothetical protein
LAFWAAMRPETCSTYLGIKMDRLEVSLTPFDRSAFWGGAAKSFNDFPEIDARMKADA